MLARTALMLLGGGFDVSPASAYLSILLVTVAVLVLLHEAGILRPGRPDETSSHCVATRALRRGTKSITKNRFYHARANLERALACFEQAGDVEGQTAALLQLAVVNSKLADKVGALACVEWVLENACDSDPLLEYDAMMTKARVLFEQGDFHRALECYGDALSMTACPSDIVGRPEATAVRDTLARVLQELIERGREEAARGARHRAEALYERGLATAGDPRFQPFDQGGFPHQLGQYRNLIAIELDHVASDTTPRTTAATV